MAEKKIDIAKLSNTNIHEEYQIEVSNRFQALAELGKEENLCTINEDQIEDKRKQDIETGWKTFLKIIKEIQKFAVIKNGKTANLGLMMNAKH